MESEPARRFGRAPESGREPGRTDLRELEELYQLVMTIIGKASEGSVDSLKAAEIADAALGKYRAFTEPSQISSEEEKADRLRHLEALLEELAHGNDPDPFPLKPPFGLFVKTEEDDVVEIRASRRDLMETLRQLQRGELSVQETAVVLEKMPVRRWSRIGVKKPE